MFGKDKASSNPQYRQFENVCRLSVNIRQVFNVKSIDFLTMVRGFD